MNNSPLTPVKYYHTAGNFLKFNLRASHPELGMELAQAIHDTFLTCNYMPTAGQFSEHFNISSLCTNHGVNDHAIMPYDPNQAVKLTTFQHNSVDDAALNFRAASLLYPEGLDLARAIVDILLGSGYRPTSFILAPSFAVSMFTNGTKFEPLIIR